MSLSEITKIEQELLDLRNELNIQIGKYSNVQDNVIVTDYESRISKIIDDYETQIGSLLEGSALEIEALKSQHNNELYSLRLELQEVISNQKKVLADSLSSHTLEKENIIFTKDTELHRLQSEVDELTNKVMRLKKSEYDKDTEIVRLMNLRSAKVS
jgi:hypothetical protein